MTKFEYVVVVESGWSRDLDDDRPLSTLKGYRKVKGYNWVHVDVDCNGDDHFGFSSKVKSQKFIREMKKVGIPKSCIRLVKVRRNVRSPLSLDINGVKSPYPRTRIFSF